MTKSFWYKQKYYRDSAWNQFQHFLAFELMPFVVAAVLAVGVVIVLFAPFLLMAD